MLTDAQREAQRRYRDAHREELRAKNSVRMALRTPEQVSANNRRFREKHRDELNARHAEWRAANLERHRANAKRWAQENPERYRANQERWKRDNRDYSTKRYQNDERQRVTTLLRACIHTALTRRASGRDWRADARIGAILGCSKPDLIAHIEAQFLPGMSWSNYGRKGWEIDHIKPCASFDLTQHDQVLLCFHYTNLRPLWRADNQRRPRKE
jgi:hypothetical protein